MNLIIFALIFFSVQLQAIENKFCTTTTHENLNNTKYREIQKDLLGSFSSNPIIATDADKLLTVLTGAKSPMILKWIKNRKLNPETQSTQIVQEWRLYFALNFVINRYPTHDQNKDSLIEDLFESLSQKLLNEDLKKQFESDLQIVQKLAIAKINNYSMNDSDKKIITDKIQKIKIYWPAKLKNSKYTHNPLEFFDWALAYDPHNNEINVGLNSIYYNPLNLKTALLHEIAHSFDSCRWSSQNIGKWPFEKVGTCLRNIAKIRDDSKLESLYQKNKINKNDYDFFKANLTCNNSLYPPIGIQSDQLPEVFADWFAAETVSQLEVSTSLRSDLCDDHALNSGSSYLSNHDRLFKIYLSNLELQKKLKFKSEEKYCDF